MDLSQGFVHLAAGGGHNLSLKSDGSIVAGGRNRSDPINVLAPDKDFFAVACGAIHVAENDPYPQLTQTNAELALFL